MKKLTQMLRMDGSKYSLHNLGFSLLLLLCCLLLCLCEFLAFPTAHFWPHIVVPNVDGFVVSALTVTREERVPNNAILEVIAELELRGLVVSFFALVTFTKGT